MRPTGPCRATEGVPTLRPVEGNLTILPTAGPSRLWWLILRAALSVCGGVAIAFLLALIFARPAAAQTTGQAGTTGACPAGPTSVVAHPAASVVSGHVAALLKGATTAMFLNKLK